MTKSWELREITYFNEDSGTLSVVEYGKTIEFDVKRVFFLNKLLSESIRGNHAHKELRQLIICTSGSFDIELDDGINKETISLMDDGKCLFIDGMVWRVMRNFSEECVVTVLCDREYEFDLVISDYDEFSKMTSHMKNV